MLFLSVTVKTSTIIFLSEISTLKNFPTFSQWPNILRKAIKMRSHLVEEEQARRPWSEKSKMLAMMQTQSSASTSAPTTNSRKTQSGIMHQVLIQSYFQEDNKDHWQKMRGCCCCASKGLDQNNTPEYRYFVKNIRGACTLVISPCHCLISLYRSPDWYESGDFDHWHLQTASST